MDYKFLDLAGLGSLIEKLKTIFASSAQGEHADSAYQHILIKSGNPHNVTKSDIGLSNVENKNSATIRSELTKSEVVKALGYTPPTQDTNTTYNVATQSSNGLLSSNDKVKLDGISEGANKYVLPTASSTTLGGVKTTSNVTSNSGYTACPIISGVPYYKDTKLSSFGVTATADELNKLDGCTATVTELNYVDGVTSSIQVQLNGKAALSHNHSASNITSGILPITRGGTGGTSSSTARENIDAINILVQESQPASQNVGDFWLEFI